MRPKQPVPIAVAGLAMFAAAIAPHAGAAEQTYPVRPIRLIVPQAPGGSNDILARYFGAKLAERVGHQVVVDNRPGAEGMIGTDMVAKSNPDGYTMLMTSTAFTMNPAVVKMPYDPIKDFDWATMLGSGPVLVTVGASLPAKTLQELVTLAKSKPNYITMASAGGFMHFVSAMFKSHAGFDGVIALYKGGAPALIDVVSGQAHVAIATIPTGGAFVRSQDQGARHRGRQALGGVPRRADHGRGRDAGLPGFDLVGLGSARGHAAAGARKAQCRDRGHPEAARNAEAPRLGRRRDRHAHAGRDARVHSAGHRALDQGRQRRRYEKAVIGSVPAPAPSEAQASSCRAALAGDARWLEIPFVTDDSWIPCARE